MEINIIFLLFNLSVIFNNLINLIMFITHILFHNQVYILRVNNRIKKREIFNNRLKNMFD
jgi:hypothetical protein